MRMLEEDDVAPMVGTAEQRRCCVDGGLQFVGRADAAERRGHGVLVDVAARDLPHEVLLDHGNAGFDPVMAHIVQQNVVAAERADMGDTRTHLASANDADRLDLNHPAKPQ